MTTEHLLSLRHKLEDLNLEDEQIDAVMKIIADEVVKVTTECFRAMFEAKAGYE